MNQSHVEEIFAAIVAFCAHGFKHEVGIQFLQVNVVPHTYDMANKFINLLFGVVTACIAYLAVWLIKKYITKEK